MTGRCRISAKNKNLRDVLSRFTRFSPCVWGLSVATLKLEEWRRGHEEWKTKNVDLKKCVGVW